MKILGFPPRGYVGIYRVRYPMAALRRAGLATVMIHEDRDVKVEDLLRYDLIVWARQQAPAAELGNYFARAHGVRVVFDVDDNEFCIPRSNPARREFWHAGQKAERLISSAKNMRSADLVTTTNEQLRQDLLWFNENVRVLPNQIDAAEWHGIVPIPHQEPWIMFCGSSTHQDSLQESVEPISRFLGQHRDSDVKLVLVGYPAAAQLFGPDLQDRIIPVPWGQGPGYQRWLVSADVVIRPSVDTRFQRCKSDNPVLEAGACGFSRNRIGIPIVTGAPTYQETMEAAGCGALVARSPEEWSCILEDLVLRRDSREHYGAKLFSYVAQNRLIDQHAGDWYQVYRGLLDG